jgi:hypothetical protein
MNNLSQNITSALNVLKGMSNSAEAFFTNPLVIALREAEASAKTVDELVQQAFTRLEDANRAFKSGVIPNSCGVLQSTSTALDVAVARTDMALKIANTIAASHPHPADRAILARAKLLR